MARAPFQCLILPYRIRTGADGLEYPEFAVFHRADWDIWQFVSGGGEDDETPAEAAARELWEETGIRNVSLYPLDAVCTISAGIFSEERRSHWGAHCYVIPEYAFAVRLTDQQIRLSKEHTTYEWLTRTEAEARLRFDSNRIAMIEIDERLREGYFPEKP